MIQVLNDKQQAILDAALELIGEHGFHGTPVSAIAQRAGVGAGTIYRYWPGKEELINALYVREKLRMNAEILAGTTPGMSVRDALRRIWANALALKSRDEARFRFLDQYYNSPFIGDETKRLREQMVADYAQLFERGVREGVLRDQAAALQMALVFGPLSTLSSAIRSGEMELDEALIEETFDSVWRSIAAD